MKTRNAIFWVGAALGIIGILMVKRDANKQMDDTEERMLFNYYLMLSGKLS